MYSCYYCGQGFTIFCEIITHLLENHGCEEIKFRKCQGSSLTTISFKIIPEMCREQGRIITIDENNNKIHVSKADTQPKESPVKKLFKRLTVNENEQCTEGTNCEVEDMEEGDPVIDELVSLLPGVVSSLRECGKLKEYVAFNHLVNKKRFPLNNVAFLLFLDVVRWFDLESSTNTMRYSKEVKLFWKTGLRLFHGRFLRFMGGPKNKGQVLAGSASPGEIYSETSNINFAVPDRRVLQDEERIIQGNKPGIFHSMIDAISLIDKHQTCTYKICVDGKKLNPSSSGEVDLWGFENKPTYEEKQTRLNDELQCLEQLQTKVERYKTFGKTLFTELSEDEQMNFSDQIKHIVRLVAHRMKDLRQLKVNKELLLTKLLSKVEGDWKSSQYAMVISSIRTAVVQIEMCIDGFLECSTNLCQQASQTGVSAQYVRTSDQVNLQNQGNFVCLGNNTDENNVDSSVIKQRSDAWFEIRKSSLVTGSTIQAAIGLNGLKKQREHLEMASGSRESMPVSEDLQRKFDHGTANEINAVATLVSTVLPAHFPTGIFFEEGCYITEKDQRPILVVSPDGSIRKNDKQSNVLFGIEIKCPMPGKLYSTPVHYSIPSYYIPQILSEMFALETDKLLYISYSNESTTVQEADFDENLWSDILEEITNLSVNNIPRRKQTMTASIKEKIDKYRNEKVRLVAEIRSQTAITCEHPDCNSTRVFHTNVNNANLRKCQHFREVHKTLLRCTELLHKCHKLCVQRASEVIVFLLSDLDRTYKSEKLHAYPIAYGLRGYSVRSESMRKMIQEVLHALSVKSLYTPVVAYDGEWAPIAFKNSDGKPLTILELQRHVYNDIKKRSKQNIVRTIAETAVVRTTTYDEVLQQTDYIKKENGVEIGVRSGVKLFCTSKHIEHMLKSNSQKRLEAKDTADELQGSTDDILSSMPAELIQQLDDDVIESVNSLNANKNFGLQHSDYDLVSTENLAILTNDVSSNDPDENVHPYSSEDMDVHVHPSQAEDSVDCVSDTGLDTVLSKDDVHDMFKELQLNRGTSGKWTHKSLDQFESLVRDPAAAKNTMTKNELLVCFNFVQKKLSDAKLRFSKSWNKEKMTNFLNLIVTSSVDQAHPRKQKTKRITPVRLSALCKRKINGFTKAILNAVMAEHVFLDEYKQWAEESPFGSTTRINGVGNISWFSVPEYNQSTLSYIYSFLDVHHLITNCRIKVCKDGFPQRNINRQAWMAVVQENKTKLKRSHVEDLVDKQSDSIARETFSSDVSEAMNRLGFQTESQFCKLIREFYEAEDDPGISALERCNRRMNLRGWLLQGVNFSNFPPYGFYIRGIPHVMFQGLLTNIERRIQLFPYVKSGAYNVRTLGSLEAENLFGAFQDLDPKGSGVIKAQDIPSALETACQLHKTRLLPDLPFHMTLSAAKVYPVHELLDQDSSSTGSPFLYPQHTPVITVKDHSFDARTRAKRKPKRKVVGIADTDQAARGVAPIRQYHRCDESKILAHKRAGIDIK